MKDIGFGYTRHSDGKTVALCKVQERWLIIEWCILLAMFDQGGNVGTLVFSVRSQRLFELGLSSQHISIGRSDTCDVSLPGEGLSRQHCTLSRRGHRWMPQIPRSMALLGEEKITKRILGYGATFQIGPYAVSLQETTDSVEETVSVFPKAHEFIVACDDALVMSVRHCSIWTRQGWVLTYTD